MHVHMCCVYLYTHTYTRAWIHVHVHTCTVHCTHVLSAYMLHMHCVCMHVCTVHALYVRVYTRCMCAHTVRRGEAEPRRDIARLSGSWNREQNGQQRSRWGEGPQAPAETRGAGLPGTERPAPRRWAGASLCRGSAAGPREASGREAKPVK